MEIVKKNILNIICGVVAVVAVVLWFWPLGSWKSEAQAKLSQRATVNVAMQSLLKQPRSLPSVSLDGGTTQKLDVFPTPKVIAWADGLKQKLADEAQLVKKEAVAMNVRPVLLEGVLPVAQPTKDYEFREVYLKAVQALPGKLRMGPPPTSEEIDAAIEKLWVTQYEPRVVKRDGIADPASLQEQQEASDKESKLVPERLKQQRAKDLLCYMSEGTVVPDAAIGSPSSGTAPLPQTIWYAQMHYWVQEEVLSAIVEANRRASKQQCVIDAPVKYVRTLTIAEYRGDLAAIPAAGGEGAGAGMGGPRMGGGGGLSADDAALMRAARAEQRAGMGPMGGGMGGPARAMAGSGGMPGESFTGRKCNALYDVIPVQLVLDVEAAQLPYVLAQLGYNGFITPYDVSISSVDSVVTSLQENVVYGSTPVVRATISCEVLMFRDWTAPLMPAPIKQALGVAGESPAPAGM